MSRKNLTKQELIQFSIITDECLPKKMQIFHCSCGEDILIAPDTNTMNSALKNHITRHAGELLTEQSLIERIQMQTANIFFQLTQA